MSSIIFFLFFIPILSIILLSVNFIFAPHKPYKEKKTPFECGYHSFSQTRSQFSISFFLFSYVFLLLDIEIILLYPYPLSALDNTIYGLFGMIIFTTIVTVGFVFELGKEALKIASKQYEEFPPDPYGFSLTQRLSSCGWPGQYENTHGIPKPHSFLTALKPCMPGSEPVIWAILGECQNIQAINELNHYYSWAVDAFNEAVIEYDFIMKPDPHYTEENTSTNMFEMTNTWATMSNYTPEVESPMWGDKLYQGLSGEFLWLSHYKNNNMGIPYLDHHYPLIKSVYLNFVTGLDHTTAPVPSLARNWTDVNDKIKFVNDGIHCVSSYYEIIRSTAQNINAHIKYGHWLIDQWEAMATQDFLDMMGLEDDITDVYWEPYKVNLLSIMEKQGYSPESSEARDILQKLGDEATPREIKKIWIQFNRNILRDQFEITKQKCDLINKSSVLSELAIVKMNQYNHAYSNWPTNPPVERLIEFTAPSPYYTSTIYNSIASLPR